MSFALYGRARALRIERAADGRIKLLEGRSKIVAHFEHPRAAMRDAVALAMNEREEAKPCP